MKTRIDKHNSIEKLQPKLRFPDFVEDWEIKKLGEIGDVKMCRRVFNDETLPEGDIPFFKISSFGKIADAFISKQLFLEYREKFSYPKKGNILISAAGTIGRLVIYNGEDAYYQDSNIVWINNDETFVNDKYLYYILQLTKFNTEGGTIQRLYNSILKSTKFSCPSLIEQTKIASFLTAVDDKLHALKQKHALLEQYKKGVMQQLFSGKLRFKDDNGNDYPDWEEKKIKDIFIVTRGNVLSMTLVSNEQNEKNLYPVYSSQTKNKGLSGFYNNFLFEDCITWTTDGAGAGDVNFRKGKFYCTNVCGVLKSDKGYANNFVSEILNSVSRKYVSYVGNPKLMNNVMSEIKISIPISIKEQTKIASFLSALDEKINQCQAQIEKTEVWKKGLLQQLFV